MALARDTTPAPRPTGIAHMIYDLAFSHLCTLTLQLVYPQAAARVWERQQRPHRAVRRPDDEAKRRPGIA